MFLHQSHHHHDNTLHSAGLVSQICFAHLCKKHFDIIDIFSCLAIYQVILNGQCN